MNTGGGGNTQSDSSDPRKHTERGTPIPGRGGAIWNDSLRAIRRAIIAAIVWMVATLAYNQMAGGGGGSSAQAVPPSQSGPALAPASPTGLADKNPMNSPEVFEGVLDAGG